MMTSVLEVVRFKLKPHVSEDAILAASEAMEHSFARQQPGFIRRTLGQGDSGEWVDVVQWESLEAASEAAVRELESPACAPFFAMIDEASIELSRFAVLQETEIPATS